MRSVSYVQRAVMEFSGSLFPHAICLGDVDNDSLNELVVGDTSGKLSVYKNDDSRPWLTCTCQGMLTCVGVGDVCNKGKNLVVAVSAEGWFHLFDLTPAKVLDASGHHETLVGEEQRPVFKQHIPANTKVMLISDIDGDGCCELVVGHTDRVVRAFRWEELSEGTGHLTGQLVSLKKWMLEGQVDSLSVTPGPLGVPELMVSQPGCAYAVLLCTWNKDTGSSPASEEDMEGSREPAAARDVVLRQTSGRIHNKNVSTHLIGNIKQGEGGVGGRALRRGGKRSSALPLLLDGPSLPEGAAFILETGFACSALHIVPSQPQATTLRVVALTSLPSAPWMAICLHRDTEAHGGSRQAAVVSAGGSPAVRLGEVRCHR
ncbi:KICSTOR complex protein ITFG2 isoform X3 [Fukomys damarensis]|uniref:KICSTOR complex protein ITFG2 isoform X3 n=1 Tax=Fukomys damarensis TaxID=885580 RepID=UPI00053F3082|nr:KICSTOR complex protein ITFG2 isoform X3 [Fukomys damarensis]